MGWYYRGEPISEDDIEGFLAIEYTQDDYQEYLTESFGTIWVEHRGYDIGRLFRDAQPHAFYSAWEDEVAGMAREMASTRDNLGFESFRYVEASPNRRSKIPKKRPTARRR